MSGGIFVGIDPGNFGAIAVLNAAGDVLSVDMCPTITVGKTKKEPDAMAMARLVWRAFWIAQENAEPFRVVIEKTSGRPKEGAGSARKIGHGAGVWEGAVAAAIAHNLTSMAGSRIVSSAASYSVLAPQTWQKAVCHDLPGDNPKGRAELFCRRRWPEWVEQNSGGRGSLLACKKRAEGAFDALCTAEACRRAG